VRSGDRGVVHGDTLGDDQCEPDTCFDRLDDRVLVSAGGEQHRDVTAPVLSIASTTEPSTGTAVPSKSTLVPTFRPLTAVVPESGSASSLDVPAGVFGELPLRALGRYGPSPRRTRGSGVAYELAQTFLLEDVGTPARGAPAGEHRGHHERGDLGEVEDDRRPELDVCLDGPVGAALPWGLVSNGGDASSSG
jgi:hypothetical protein